MTKLSKSSKRKIIHELRKEAMAQIGDLYEVPLHGRDKEEMMVVAIDEADVPELDYFDGAISRSGIIDEYWDDFEVAIQEIVGDHVMEENL